MTTSTEPAGYGNPYAERGYLHADPRTGTTVNRFGTRMLALPNDFLDALLATVEAECGPTAEAVLKASGQAWGQKFARHFEGDVYSFRGVRIAEATVAEFTGDLAMAFNHHGWGQLALDYSRHHQGLIVADVVHGIAAGPAGAAEVLTAGFLAGLFSQLTSENLDCIRTRTVGPGPGVGATQYTIGLASRVERFADAAVRGRSPDEILGELAAIRA